jgi:hypothetical protein
MNPSLQLTHHLLAGPQRPVVMVAASVEATLAMKKNRLSLADLFTPSGVDFHKVPGAGTQGSAKLL